MRITKLLGALALSGILAAGIAYAAATSSNPAAPAPQAEGDTAVTATWAMGEQGVFTGIAASYDVEGVFSSSDVVFAGSAAGKDIRQTKDADGNVITTYTVYKGVGQATVDKTTYVEYQLNVTKPVKVSDVSLEIMGRSSGNGRYDVALIIDGNETTLASNVAPVKWNNSAADASVDFSKQFVAPADVAVAAKSITLRFYLYSKDTTIREFGFANVKITGTVVETGGETPVDPVVPTDIATITWPLKVATADEVKTGVQYSVPEGYSFTSDFAVGSDISKVDLQTYEEGTTSWQATAFKLKDRTEAHTTAFDGEYVEFTVTPEVGCFQPTKLEFSAYSRAFGNGTLQAYVVNEFGEVASSKAITVQRCQTGQNGTKAAAKNTLTISNLTASKGPLTIRIYLWNAINKAASGKSIALDDVKIEGKVLAESEVTPPAINIDHVPGQFAEISAGRWSVKECSIEADNSPVNIGYIVNGSSASADFFCDEAGYYSVDCDFYWFQNPGTATFTVNNVYGKTEAQAIVELTEAGVKSFLLDKALTEGKKTLTVSFANTAGGFIANFRAPSFTRLEVGEGVVSKVEINGREAEASIVEALNANLSATETGKVYTTVPSVKATFDDDAVAEAVVSVANGNAVAEFTHPILTNKKFALTLEGVQVYNKTEVDQEYTLLYEDSGKDKPTAGNWSNGNYTLLGTSDGWGGKQFKLQINKTQEYTLEIPDNIIVKQLTFGALGDNYQNDGVFETVTSEGANVIIPTDRGFLKGGNSAMTVLFENHIKGAPIKFTVGSTGQPYMNFQLVYERYVYTGEPTNTGKSQTPTDKKNHAVVTFSFDRPMQDCVAEYNGKTVKAYGGKNDLKFSLWDLEWGAETVLTIPAGAAKDVDGNANSAALTYTVNVAAEPTSVDPVAAEKFEYVTNVDELRTAVAKANETNTSANASRFVIYIANGEYELGSDVFFGPNNKGKDEWQSPSESAVCLHLNKAYNVSLIGESRDGVIIKGERTGISNPIFSTRNSTNIYMENFTLLNYFDYGKERRGVAVCHYGGNRDIMVNILMQSQQDTQVTGAQGYYYNCEIHGSVDYVCGGGTHFYDHCVFVQQNAGAITAPSTSEALRHGYVFQNCEIKGTAGYTLGRPWQNNPSCHWLNTTMHSLPADNGWAEMGNLATRFYEFNSMDASGAALDLSGRKNSPTSTNKYNPVLTAEEAAEFTVENVLGGDDSWLATEEVVTEMTPSAGSEYLHKTENGVESEDYWWLPVAKAAGYLVYNHDALLAYVPGGQTSYNLLEHPLPALSRAAENFSFTVRAMSPNGTLSAPTRAITPDYTTGVEGVTAEEAVEVMYYNLQGQPVAEGYRGAAIKVEVAADGTRTVTKTILD